MQDSLTFLALSLDTNGRPIPVVNTDPATELFLADTMSAETMQVDLAPFLRAFPVGLLVDGLGFLVANDAYATPAIWERFREDTYHGPRVVWGREVNLFLLGLANQILRGRDDKKRSLGYALKEVLAAVYSSGLQHNELWSYEFRGRALVPVRYGTSSDVQLWNTTHLAVEFVLSQLPVMSP